MKISIITVCFNSENTIRDTLESMKNQTYKNYEYIIVDGKSTDNTLNIINEYKNTLKINLISERDHGLYDAMNKGIKKATGEIIGILNSDDWYEKYTLELVNKLFEEKNIDILVGNMNLVSYRKKFLKVKRNYDLSIIDKRMPINQPASFLSKDVYKKIGLFNLNYKVSADYDFICRAYKSNFKFLMVDKVLTNMRMGGLSGGGDGGIQGIKTALQTAKDDYIIVKNNFGKTKILNYYKKELILYLRLIKRFFVKSNICR